MKKIFTVLTIRIFLISGFCFILLLSGCRNGSREETGENPSSDSIIHEEGMDNQMMEDGMMEDGMMENGMMEDGMMENGMMEDGMMEDGMMDQEMMSEEMHRAMMSEGMGPEMMEDMQMIRKMLMNHEKIDRQVENLENGVRTRTTSPDPDIAAAIQKHVRQMKERIEKQQPIRQMDPLFRELFKHADRIEMEIENLKDGVLVIETSEDPQVVKLIQQHANRAVSEFAAKGMKRAMEPTPLPEGYEKKN